MLRDTNHAPLIDGPTPRQRMLAALCGEHSEILPAAPCYPGLFLADFERSYYLEQCRRYMGHKTRRRVDHVQDTRFRAEALYHAYGIFKERPDWIEVRQGTSYSWAERTDLVLEGGVLYYEDRLTGARARVDRGRLPSGDGILAGHDHALQDNWDAPSQIHSAADIDTLVPVRHLDKLIGTGCWDLPARVVADYGGEYFISTILDTPFSDGYDLLGFRDLMLIQRDQPDLLHALLERQLLQTQQVMGAWAVTGIDGVYVQEVFTGADIISAESFDRFVFAYNQPYFAHMRDLGLLPIYYVCGDVVPRLERVVELDIAAVAVEESKKNFRIEIEEVIDRVGGRRAVLGNIDTIRFGLHGTMEEMANEVRRQVQAGRRAKGFIVSTGSPFPLDTNPRLIDTLVSTAHSC
jgi:hypothetical protein